MKLLQGRGKGRTRACKGAMDGGGKGERELPLWVQV